VIGGTAVCSATDPLLLHTHHSEPVTFEFHNTIPLIIIIEMYPSVEYYRVDWSRLPALTTPLIVTAVVIIINIKTIKSSTVDITSLRKCQKV